MTNRKPKIFFVIPTLRAGGAEKVLVNLLKYLAFKKVEFCIFLIVFNLRDQVYLDLIPSDINVINLKSSSFLKNILSMFKLIKDYKPDVIFSWLEASNLPILIANSFAREKNKIIISVHGILSNALKFQSKVVAFAKKILIKHLYKKADKIIAVSEYIKYDLENYFYIDGNKIEIVYNPVVSDELYEKAKQSPKHIWLEQKKAPVLLSVGRLAYPKDYATLIKAFAIVRKKMKVKLIIIGDGPLKSFLKKLILETGLSNDVDVLGYKSNPYSYMARADLLILSSISEGLPTVLIEALSLGTPVISTDCGSGPSEIIENTENCSIVPIKDVSSLSREILKILKNGGRVKYENNKFLVSSAGETYIKIIKTLLDIN